MVSAVDKPSQVPLVLLSGGGGGARLAAALSKYTAQRPTVVVTNTGDDFEHLGLLICPDTDSVLYATSGKLDRVRGWGREGESWQVLDAIQGMAGPSWFQLGDKDLALHLLRAEQLRKGADLAAVTQVLSERLGVPEGMTVIPATEQSVRTRVVTEEGELAFQEYFVGRRCEPALRDVVYEGIEDARPSPSLLAALDDACVDGPIDVVLGPSNPFLSLGPILDIPGMLSELRKRARRVVAVSPIIGGRALKGPAAKIMTELDLPASAPGWTQWLAQRYPGFVDTWVWDDADGELIATVPDSYDVRVTATVMSEPGAGQGLAQWLLEVCSVAP